MYIQLISVHGLVRGTNIEMGRDADTGGQIRYVLELAKTLAKFEAVTQVDLFTRRLKDKRVNELYSQEIEPLCDKARIVRLPCGGPKYMRKEKLWPYLDEFVDGMISFTRKEGLTPAVVHGHYADAGYVGRHVAGVFDAPFIFTGHSLGKDKLKGLLERNWTVEQANKEYHIEHRIAMEHSCLYEADLVITSTRHERENQWGAYDPAGDQYFEVIPPGTDLDRFFPYYEYDMPGASIDERFKQARAKMRHELGRFFFSTEKPIILSLCRPERRKNIGALIEVYGSDKELQMMANLAVFAGIRDDIEQMPDGEQEVLTDILLLMDRYDLYGKMAIPKWHDSEFEVPELYRYVAAHRGVFCNIAFTENFGLTAIEAAACGLPFVATENGGPQDIVENTKSGILVDVADYGQIADALKKLLSDKEVWGEHSTHGINLVREFYSWERHCEQYLEAIKKVVVSPAKTPSAAGRQATGQRMASIEKLLISDIDGTLLGDDDAFERFKEVMREHHGRIAFGIASGRALNLVEEVVGSLDLEIDVIISSVGAEIYYGPERSFDKGWAAHLRHKWKPDVIREALEKLPYLSLQEADHAQREFKISYNLDDHVDGEEAQAEIRETLTKAKAPHQLIFSHGAYVDILPHRASKGKAIRYLSGKWNLPIENIATAGDSGNDLDMLSGATAGIVVGNYTDELEPLRKSRTSRVYFAEAHCAGGIIEGLEHFGFVGEPSMATAE